MGLDAGCDLPQASICGLCLSGCVLELHGEIVVLPCGIMVDADGTGEEINLFTEGLGVKGTTGCCDICGGIAGISVLAGPGLRALLTTCIRLCGRVLGGSCRYKWPLFDGVFSLLVHT